MSWILSIAALGWIIFIHELGHFMVSKVLGIHVPVFSIGFGNALIKFNFMGTEFRLGVLPLGGYVLHGEDYLSRPSWQKLMVLFGGPFFNLIFPFFLFAGMSMWYSDVSFIQAVQNSIRISMEIYQLIFVGLYDLFIGAIPMKESIAGPVSLVVMGHEAAQTDMRVYFIMLGLISMNVGIFNLFPVPLLDGGQMTLLIIEMITGRKLSRRMHDMIQMVGVLLLSAFFLFTIILDLTNIFSK